MTRRHGPLAIDFSQGDNRTGIQGGHGVGQPTGQFRFEISFKVAASGRRVGHFVFGTLPVGCQGGGFGAPQPASARVTRQGTFTAHVTLYFTLTHKKTGSLVVTGKFLNHGRERGKISSRFNFTGCDRTDRYSTRT